MVSLTVKDWTRRMYQIQRVRGLKNWLKGLDEKPDSRNHNAYFPRYSIVPLRQYFNCYLDWKDRKHVSQVPLLLGTKRPAWTQYKRYSSLPLSVLWKDILRATPDHRQSLSLI